MAEKLAIFAVFAATCVLSYQNRITLICDSNFLIPDTIWCMDTNDFEFAPMPRPLPMPLMPLVRPADYDAHAVPSPTWLIDKVIPLVGLSVWYGLPGSYKSLLALSAARAVAVHDGQWLGQRVWHLDRPVAVIDSETGVGGQTERMEAMGGTTPRVLFAHAPSLAHLAAVASLEVTIAAHRPSLVIVDAATSILGGIDLNSPTMGEALTRIHHLAVATECSILLIHQANKTSTESSGRGQDVMGSSYFSAVADVPYKIRRADGVDSPDVTFHLAKQRRNALPVMTCAVSTQFGTKKNQWGVDESMLTSISLTRAAVDIPPAPPKRSAVVDAQTAVIDAVTSGITESTAILERLMEAGYSSATVGRAVRSATASGAIRRTGRGVYEAGDIRPAMEFPDGDR